MASTRIERVGCGRQKKLSIMVFYKIVNDLSYTYY